MTRTQNHGIGSEYARCNANIGFAAKHLARRLLGIEQSVKVVQKGRKQMSKTMLTSGALLAMLLLVNPVSAQRGTGERKGVARETVKPAVQTIVGTLKEIKTGPCEEATGGSPIGTHLILEADKATYNLHLGPASEVKDVVEIVRVGEKVEATAFRTARLPKDHFVAVTVKATRK
jgi:hypothetical protein